jgi:hypothetical protein
MKFKQILKRKVYPTWVSTRRIKGCKVFIYYMPREDFYHFQIDKESDIIFISLAEGIKFKTFDECCSAAEKWIYEILF